MKIYTIKSNRYFCDICSFECSFEEDIKAHVVDQHNVLIIKNKKDKDK